ncbi:NTP transferase domain-containing protein [Halobacteria archaeon HArc-gm2]|nr:NTP transferase domain-containing protein [Halobacteria archaeon HArc-gm2]
MRAVILAAGEGSRMGVHTEDRPKAFMDLGGRTLYARQRAVLDEYVDDVTVVLGYAADNVRDEVGGADVVVVEDWDDYDNAESLRRALQVVDDDVLVLNGDVIVTEQALEELLGAFARAPAGRNVVGCIRGDQEESTAVRCDEEGVVTDYGMIRGPQHAGVGVVDRSTVGPAASYLADHREEWYPVVYPAFATDAVAIPRAHHVEINRPQDKVRAMRKLPMVATSEADVEI